MVSGAQMYSFSSNSFARVMLDSLGRAYYQLILTHLLQDMPFSNDKMLRGQY